MFSNVRYRPLVLTFLTIVLLLLLSIFDSSFIILNKKFKSFNILSDIFISHKKSYYKPRNDSILTKNNPYIDFYNYDSIYITNKQIAKNYNLYDSRRNCRNSILLSFSSEF